MLPYKRQEKIGSRIFSQGDTLSHAWYNLNIACEIASL